MIEPRVLIIWLVIFTVILGLATIGNSGASTITQLTVAEAVKVAAKGGVATGTITSDVRGGESWYKMEGTLRSMHESDPASAVATQRFVAEGRVTADDFEVLRNVFREKRANNWMTDLVGEPVAAPADCRDHLLRIREATAQRRQGGNELRQEQGQDAHPRQGSRNVQATWPVVMRPRKRSARSWNS
jgi:hypothetical protein